MVGKASNLYRFINMYIQLQRSVELCRPSSHNNYLNTEGRCYM